MYKIMTINVRSEIFSRIVMHYVVIFLIHLGCLVDGLKLLDVRINNHTLLGSSTTLTCIYDLEGETLYSVKWYKDGDEFFRYLPKSKPEIQVFEQKGIHIDIDKSNSNEVVLDSLQLSSSGSYRCEVSAEAPSFQTVAQERDMLTVALPESPHISGLQSKYIAGEIVNANCTLNHALPLQPQLVWYINNKKINSTVARSSYLRNRENDHLGITVLDIRFKVNDQHINNEDTANFKCVAKLASVYLQSDEQTVKFLKRSPAESMISNINLNTGLLSNQIQVTSSGKQQAHDAVFIIFYWLVFFFLNYYRKP